MNFWAMKSCLEKGYWDPFDDMETPFLDYVTRLTNELNIPLMVDSILGNDVKNMINEGLWSWN